MIFSGTKASGHRGIGVTMLAICAGATALTGCRGDYSESPPRQFFPDMDDQPKVKAQSKSHFFKDYEEPDAHGHGEKFGRGMRLPVPNTVAFGTTAEVAPDGSASFMGKDFGGRADLLRADDSFYVGYTPVLDEAGHQVMNADGTKKRTYLDYIPVPVTRELIAEGRAQYNIYCIVCHGGTGEGNGMVGQRWAAPLPNYHDPKYFHGGDKGQDGYIFSVIREGVPNIGGPETMPYKMRPYATKVSEHESWAIVAYIRTLQEHRKGSISDVPADQRDKLMQTNTNPMPKAPEHVHTTGGAL